MGVVAITAASTKILVAFETTINSVFPQAVTVLICTCVLDCAKLLS